MNPRPQKYRQELFRESIIERQLFEKVKDIVWYIEVTCIVNRVARTISGTGFSLSEDGVIMTCDHVICSVDDGAYNKIIIKVRRHDEKIFRAASVKFRRPTWDVAILKLDSPISCKRGHLASNGSLYVGQPLAHLGNPNGHPMTFMVGRVAQGCVDDVIIPTGNQICATYNTDVVRRTPPYYIMGHIKNCKTLQGAEDYEKNLHPMVPVVLSSGFAFTYGCSGGPLFRSDGTIIGMIRSVYSIHVSVLKQCLREFEDLGVDTSQHI